MVCVCACRLLLANVGRAGCATTRKINAKTEWEQRQKTGNSRYLNREISMGKSEEMSSWGKTFIQWLKFNERWLLRHSALCVVVITVYSRITCGHSATAYFISFLFSKAYRNNNQLHFYFFAFSFSLEHCSSVQRDVDFLLHILPLVLYLRSNYYYYCYRFGRPHYML